jgi:hypothetical protein
MVFAPRTERWRQALAFAVGGLTLSSGARVFFGSLIPHSPFPIPHSPFPIPLSGLWSHRFIPRQLQQT